MMIKEWVARIGWALFVAVWVISILLWLAISMVALVRNAW